MEKIKQDFEKKFRHKESELLVLIEDRVNGAAVLKDNLLSPSVRILASVTLENNTLSKGKGILVWLHERKDGESGYGYSFERYQICKVRVRKNIPIELEPYMSEIANNRYLLLEVLDYDVKHEKLQEITEYLSKPVIIEEDFGTFELNRTYDSFEGRIKFIDKECSIDMQTDSNGESAIHSLNHLKILLQDQEKWDENFKRFATQELLDLANDWAEDDVEITEQDFISKISVSSIGISRDGSLIVYYEDGDLFLGHVIEISADINGTMESANIAG